jgi:hypothetical protein
MDTRQRLSDLEVELRRIEGACQHQWLTPEYDPYEAAGSQHQRWSRTCSVCGKQEFTRRRGEDGIPFFNF